MKRFILIGAIVGFGSIALAESGEGAGTYGYAWLRSGEGARAMAMGGAMITLAEPRDAVFWNPARIAGAMRPGFALGYRQLFEGVNAVHGAAVQPVGNQGAIAWSITGTSFGALVERDATGVETGSFSPYNASVGLGHGLPLGSVLGSVHIGYQGRFLMQGIDDHRSSALSFDLGAEWSAGDLNLGAAVRNLGVELSPLEETEEALPSVWALGSSWSPSGAAFVAGADLEFSGGASMILRLGAEYIYGDRLAIRTGYTSQGREQSFEPSAADGLTGGFGVSLGSGLIFDYALAIQGDLGLGHRITIGYDFP